MPSERHIRLVRLIRSTTFTRVRVREGYDMGDVDRFLDRLAGAVEADRPVTDMVARARFTPVRLREGYDMAEVDDLLDQFVAEADEVRASAPPLAIPDHLRELVDELEHTRFSPVWLRDGYDMDEVDAFLDRVIMALRAGEPLGPVLFGVDFTLTGFCRGGYASAEVDDLVARLRRS